MQILQVASLDSLLFTPLLLGLVATIIVAIIIIIGTITSRELHSGVTFAVHEILIEGFSDRKEVFLSNLRQELARRGIIARDPLEGGYDLIYRGFFNETRIYAKPEGHHLRYGFRIAITRRAIWLGILLLTPFLFGGIVVLALVLMKENHIRQSLLESSECAILLSRNPSSYS